MKMKTKIKIFLAVLIGIIAIICQECLRRHFDINPQIWVFVVYAMAMAGLYLIICAFRKELGEPQLEKTAQKWVNRKFISLEEERNKVKRVIKRFLKSRVYREKNFIETTFLCCYIIYTPFFSQYFFPSKFAAIILLLIAEDFFTNAIVFKKISRRIFYVAFGIWNVFTAVSMFM